MGIIDELKEIFNMSESKRRSRLGVGVAKWEGNQPWYYRNPLADWLGNKRPEKKDGEVLPDKFVTQFGDEKAVSSKLCK